MLIELGKLGRIGQPAQHPGGARMHLLPTIRAAAVATVNADLTITPIIGADSHRRNIATSGTGVAQGTLRAGKVASAQAVGATRFGRAAGKRVAATAVVTPTLTTLPSWSFNFADTGQPDPRLNLTRASSGTYFDSDGVMQTATDNVQRIHHDSRSKICYGLLIEKAATNQALRSEEFDNASWTKTGVTITANQGAAPDGATTMDLLAFATTSTNSAEQDVTARTSAGSQYTTSFYIRSHTTTIQAIRIYMWDDVTGFTDVAVSATGETLRYSVTATYNAASTSRRIGIRNAAAGGTKNIRAWGAQCEAGAWATSYIPTTSAAVSRAADAATFALNSSNFSQTAGTLGVIYHCDHVGSNQFEGVVALDSGSADDMVGFTLANTAGVVGRIRTAANDHVTLFGATFATVQDGTRNHLMMAWANNDCAATALGRAVAADSSVTLPSTINTLRFGATTGTAFGDSYLDGCIAKVTYTAQRQSNASMQTATQHPMLRGINGHPVSQTGYLNNHISYASQMSLLNDLGVQYYRFDVNNGYSLSAMDALFTAASNAGITLCPILAAGWPGAVPNGHLDNNTEAQLEDAAETFAFTLVDRFKGSTTYWELSNELDRYAMIQTGETWDLGGTWPFGTPGGSATDHYYTPRYNKTRGLIRGLGTGARAADSTCTLIVDSAGWQHYGFIQRLVNDAVPFDILAWHWYEPTMGDIQYAGDLDVFNAIVAFGKPIWLNEHNRDFGSQNSGEAAEATILASQLAYWKKLYPRITAAFPYELLDETWQAPSGEATYGIHTTTNVGGTWTLGSPKPAYTSVQDAYVP
jgi:hypothetical protein